MAPDSRIYLTRHAEGFHNVEQDWNIHDPDLTPFGKEQAESIASLIPELQQRVDLIVTSPLRRAIQTTLRTWRPAVDRIGRDRIICLPEAQECLDFACDCGSPKEELEQDEEFSGLDFSRLSPDWTSKTGFYAPDSHSTANRAKWVRHFLRERPEKEIVLLAHGDFLREITCDSTGPSRHMWRQVEIQIFRFDEASINQDACLLKLDRMVDTSFKARV